MISGPATDSGQKVHNLRVAVNEVDPQSEVLVFVDTDARPRRTGSDNSSRRSRTKRWARRLVIAGLFPSEVELRRVCAVFGMRRSRRRSAVTLRKTFAGAARLRSAARHFEDSTSANAGAERSLTISRSRAFSRKQNCRFTSRHTVSLLPSATATFEELFEFTTRQIKITRVYASHLWLPLLLGSALFAVVFFGGLILLILQILKSCPRFILALFVFLIIFTLGAAKSFIRWRAISIPLINIVDLRAIFVAHIFSGRSPRCFIFTTRSSRAFHAASHGAALPMN